MRNIGKEMEIKLNAIGICSAEELRETGSKEAFFRLKIHYPSVCLVHLYTLQGAIDDMGYNRLPDVTKRDLKAYRDGLKEGVYYIPDTPTPPMSDFDITHIILNIPYYVNFYPYK